MANYVEYIKVANGESWPIRDPQIRSELSSEIQAAKSYADEQNAATMTQMQEYVNQNSGGRLVELWTNEAPNTSLGESTVASGLGLSNYFIYIIECRHSTSYGYAATCTVVGHGSGHGAFVHFPKTSFSGTLLNDTHRYFFVNSDNDTVTCSNGYANGSESSSACIPVRIFGVKL